MLMGAPALQAGSLPPSALKAVRAAQENFSAGEYTRAIETLQAYIAEHPHRNNYLIELNLGNAYALEDAHGDAITHYRASIAMKDDYAPAWTNLARSLAAIGKYSEAAESFIRAHELHRERPDELLYFAAVAYLRANEPHKACSHLEKLADRNQPQTSWLEALLQCYLLMEEPDKGIAVTRKLISKDGGTPRWWKYLAHFHLAKEDYTGALNALLISSYLHEARPEEVALLGDLAAAAGIPRLAAEIYAGILNESADAGRKLIYARLAARDTPGALEAIDAALRREKDKELYFIKGQILFRDEKFVEALNAFESCLKIDSTYARAHVLAAYCLIEQGDYVAACKRLSVAANFPAYRSSSQELIRQLERLIRHENQS